MCSDMPANNGIVPKIFFLKNLNYEGKIVHEIGNVLDQADSCLPSVTVLTA